MRNSRNVHITALLMLLLMASPCLVITNGSARIYAQVTDVPEGSTAYYELNIRDRFKRDDWSGGKQLLDKALEKYPQMSAFNELMGKYLLHVAEVEVDKNNTASTYDRARFYLIRAINIDEKNVQARFLMLQLETETKHYSSAIVYCNDLLEENPYNEDLWRKKIDLYRNLGNNDEADRLLERIQQIYPADTKLKEDLVDRMETKLLKQRQNGDVRGQEQTLRELVELDPKSPDHHLMLVNLLYRNGRVAEAAETASQGAAMTRNTIFVEKRASMLCEMNRHREAVEYVKNYIRSTGSRSLSSLLLQLETEAARAAQYNDPYTAYAKIYDSHHSIEALDYLVATSMQRWYLDDALIYIGESLKRKGESAGMLYNQYLVNKRLGNTRKANTLLERLYSKYPDDESIAEEMMLLNLERAKELMEQEQYHEAIPLLEKVCTSGTYSYIRESAFQRLYNCYSLTRQYAKAEKMLEEMEGISRITHSAMLYSEWGKSKKALDFLAETYYNTADSTADWRAVISQTYEEIAVPYVKNLLIENKVSMACAQIKEAIEICPESDDLLRYGITASQRANDTIRMESYIMKGLQQHPYETYYILKDAQLKSITGKYQEALDELTPILEIYPGDSLLISIYVESCMAKANDCLDKKNPDMALETLQKAIELAPDSYELYRLQGQAYEQKKDWLEAYKSYIKYKPGYAEFMEYRHLLEEVSHHTLNNSVSLEYQQARPGSDDVISGNAYAEYSHVRKNKDVVTLGLGYAGRDGSVEQSDTEMTRGGTGVQLSGGYEHIFSHRFTGKVELGAANRYFPMILARLSCTYDLKKDWQLSGFASYRLLRSYSGVYGWQSEIVGYDEMTNAPIYGDPQYIRTGWQESKKSMLQVGAGLSKTIENFVLSGGLSGLLFDSKVYFNSNLKMQFFPVEGNSSHIFAVGGVGSAPESSLIDRSLPVSFSKLNTFVGIGASYFVNRWMTVGLAGNWYTMLSQSERLETTYIANDPYIREDYRNYFYIHANVKISF